MKRVASTTALVFAIWFFVVLAAQAAAHVMSSSLK